MTLLEQFQNYQKKIQQYGLASSLLRWDLSTASPKKGKDCKVEAIGFFSSESFRLKTAPEYGNLLKTLSAPEQFSQLEPATQVTIQRCYKNYLRFTRVPQDFYTEMITTNARSNTVWEEAKQKKDYALFAPWLDRVISMKKQYLRYIEPDKDPYQVLLEDYEEGMDMATIDSLFTELKEGLIPLIDRIKTLPHPDFTPLKTYCPVEWQRKVQDMLLSYIGFDFEGGCVAERAHPFTSKLCFGDVRLTNDYDEYNPLSAMFSAIHEGGHGIFLQNISPVYKDTAVAQVTLMGLHESQSRFLENILGRNINFWKPIYGKLRELLPPFREISLELFTQAINYVHPSMIRVDADEVTYCLHIILRYELEKAIFYDDVTADRLPSLWNEKMEELLGIRPADDGEGILQDMHWANGMFGYFPTYLLGSIYDGMFLQQVRKELGDLDVLLAEGRILEIVRWLNEKVHQHGSLYTGREVIKRVCGQDISAKPLLEYFYTKYT